MIEFISQPWPWYIAGPVIGLLMLVLLYFGETFGISGNLRTMCSMMGAGRVASFFRFDWKQQSWNLVLILGAVLGGFVTNQYLSNEDKIDLSPASESTLQAMGFQDIGHAFVPPEIFGMEALSTLPGVLFLVVGGIFVGFGTRYAGGCTSGHAITGLSNLQLPSLIAVIGFFIGGLFGTHFIIPLFFGL